MFPVENWPPGSFTSCPVPDGLIAARDRLQHELRLVEQEYQEWSKRTEQRRIKAWVEWHDEHGWPEDPGYSLRLKGKVSA